ncbi:NAD(P)-dependent oxidoreductase [Actinopolymorpha pittospori]|uniref:D-3-phosphoglycerate dehydrogenase n=1 Tax=Actinopolymorpha pittospori TaxID=648752 RepID=A0A927MW69_9ACTN|nr:NAD(P)-dependent oxidoreductase [Actinopolymorpha pittospori]MBE1607387.1 D-3-phosphoglycerate dehydrogenase [Actinopolymorpha pittospori]
MLTAPDRLILVIGDPFVSAAAMAAPLRPLLPAGYAVVEHDWPIALEEAVEVNRVVERAGPDAARLAPLPDLDAERLAGVVTGFHPLTASTLSGWPRLSFVATLRAGTEHIDDAELRRRGVPLVNNAGRNANAVAEFTVASILGHLRHVGEGHHAIRTGGWRPTAPKRGYQELSGATVGLVGFGAVGALVARRLRGFETRVLVSDPWADLSGHAGVRGVPLPELLREADIVSLHARLTPQTRHLLGAAELDLLAPHALLVNTARAELVDEEALVERVVDGRIAGAVLDVFGTEPLPRDHPLRVLPSVSLSPHLAGSTVQARTRAPALLAERIVAVLRPSGSQVAAPGGSLL